MLEPTSRPRSLASAAALMAVALGVTALLGVPAGAQTAKGKAAERPSAANADSEAGASLGKGTQAIVALVNDEPITAWEIEQRTAFLAANSGPNPRDMKAKAEARWAQIVKDPKTNERFQEILRQKQVQSREQAQALQMEYVKKLQGDMVEQLKREFRSGNSAQFKKNALNGLIDERLKVQEGKKLGVELTEDDLKRTLTGIAENNKMTLDQFAQHLRATAGFDISTLRERIRADQTWREVVRRRYGAIISVNQKDIDRLLTAAASESGEDTVELQVQKITLPVGGRGDQAAMVRRYSEAQALHTKFDGCKSLPGLAKETADVRVEDLKFVRPSNVPEPTRSLLLVAKDGDLLPPATQGNAIELYAVCGRRAVKGDDRQREKATQELQAKEFEIAANRRLVDLRQEAHIEYR